MRKQSIDIYAICRRHLDDARLDQPLGQIEADDVDAARATAAALHGGEAGDYSARYVVTRSVLDLPHLKKREEKH